MNRKLKLKLKSEGQSVRIFFSENKWSMNLKCVCARTMDLSIRSIPGGIMSLMSGSISKSIYVGRGTED